MEYFCGTNESIKYSSTEELLSKYSVNDITYFNYQTLNKLY